MDRRDGRNSDLDMKNKIAKFFQFRNMKKFSYLKYENFHFKYVYCEQYYISLIKK